MVDSAFISGRMKIRQRRRIHHDEAAKDVFSRFQGETKVTDAGVQDLQKALPKLKIHR
jgi:hypothetical protein